MIKMAAFAAACCCLVAVATALLCAVNSVQPGPYMVRTAMTPVICVCSYLLNVTGDINQCYCVVQTEEGCIYIIIIIRVHHVQKYTRAILPHAALCHS